MHGGVLLGVRGRDCFNRPKVRRLFHQLIHRIQSYLNDSLTTFNPILLKRAEFSYENEVRAVIVDRRAPKLLGDVRRILADYPKSQAVDIEPNNFVDSIIVSPVAPRWYFDAVKSVVESFGCRAPVSWSKMKADPLHLIEQPDPGQMVFRGWINEQEPKDAALF